MRHTKEPAFYSLLSMISWASKLGKKNAPFPKCHTKNIDIFSDGKLYVRSRPLGKYLVYEIKFT